MKLSPRQQDILLKMANGWELGFSLGLRERFWIQEGGLHKGGPVILRNITLSSWTLYENGLIRRRSGFSPLSELSPYELTEAGKALAAELAQQAETP